MQQGTPAPDIEIDIALVTNLLQTQHPDLAHLPIYRVDTGWDNVIFRLGEDFAIRLPCREMAAKLIEHEQIWLPQIAPRLSIPVPNPYRIGKPNNNYPWSWSIVPWLVGTPSDRCQPHPEEAVKFATFLRHLHQAAPEAAPKNPFRGVPLQQREAMLSERMQRLITNTNFITLEIQDIWHQALDAPIDTESTWIHGDLHPANILVEKGAIAGIIDWGDITSGGIATDLATIWMVFAERDARDRIIAEYGNISEATLKRAKGWAIFFGVVLLDTGLIDNPRYAKVGEMTLNRLLVDRK
ncbi:aminoglycoside phosphotransferase family protein [Calothrix sp. 336/3]|uniref:aminoglycoside phosphotransferase family protein n=1 Tax=Calothrix sp. 336/3 TaxID=1337936 RepID=UPI0004E40CB9|nr:aminoglycoside phosphotransferase family protein [Calothrix sp. 336/3]AKG19954.1 phosphotransferase [Calothrix sp. 336/3]